MSEVVRPCKNCGAELSSYPELRLQLCGQQYLKNRMAKISVIAIITFFLVGIGWANAQVWQDIEVQVNGQPYLVNAGDPHFVQALPNSFITGMIHTAEPMTPICSLQGCTPTTQSDASLGGYDEKFTGQMGNDTTGQQFVFKVLNEQNLPVATIIFVNPPNIHMFDRPTPSQSPFETAFEIFFESIGYVLLAVILGAVVLGIVGAIRHMKRQNGRWRMN